MKEKGFRFIIQIISLFFFVSSPATAALAKDDLFGKRVTNIRFAVESPFEISYLELVSLLSIVPGDILTQEKIRQSVNSLQSKSAFRKISVYGEAREAGVEIVFLLEPFVSLASIRVKGVKYFSGREVISKLRLRKGKSLNSVEVAQLKNRLLNLYEAGGYHDAKVDIKIACNLEGGMSEMLISVAEGKKPKMDFADIRGNEVFSDEEITRILNVQTGQTLNLKKVSQRVENLVREYKKEGFLLVRVSDPEIEQVNGETHLIVIVEERERFVIRFAGNERYSDGKLIGVSGVYTGVENYEGGIVDSLEKKIRSFYINKGFPFVSVDVVLRKPGNEIFVKIDEGGRRYIGSIMFDGNEYVSDKELRSLMDTSKRGFFSFLSGSGIFKEDILDSDLENLRGYYQSRGFPNAKISVGEMGRSEEGKLQVRLNVSEGVRYVVRDIGLRGVTFFATREIWKNLRNVPGVPIDYVSAYADSFNIQKMYRDRGFDDCKVTIAFDTDEETGEIDITYTVFEGERYVLGTVLVTGNEEVSSDVILRELTVSRGDIFGEADLLKFQQRLYRTGLFRSVKTRKIKNLENREINLLLEVDESDALVLEGGFGWGTDTGYRGSAGVTHKNINGLGRRIESTIIVSEKESKFDLDLTEPWFLGLNVDGGLNFTIQNTEEESFTLEKISLGGSLTRKFWERSSYAFEITFNRERTKDVSPGAIVSPEDVRDDRSILFRSILVLDQRDDPFNPRRGTFNSLVGEVSPGILGSEIEYFKVTAQSVGYFRLKNRIIFALSGRGGYGESLRGSELPIDKRFFLGGRTTVRGFKEDRLGPLGDDGSPIGGDTMININSEVRFYVTNSLIFGVFLDAGSVWLRDLDAFGFDLRETAGYSIKYVTPVGPVSFDQGYKLDRKTGESKSEIHFTIGATF